MKKLSLPFLLLWTLEGIAATIIVKTPFNTPQNDSIYLTGSMPTCRWQTRCLKGQRKAPNLFVFTFKGKRPPSFEFKITRGEWSSEAADAQGRPLPNSRSQKGDHPQVLNLINWKDKGPLKLMGKLKSYHLWSPEIGEEFRIDVLLPPGYHRGKEAYPVIYAQDGQNLFDPRQTSFGIDWALDETLAAYSPKKKFIAVAIHPNQREDDYNYFSRGKLYAQFLARTVVAWVDSQFKTKKTSRARILLGSSYGAIIAFTTQWLYPRVFGFSLGLSFPAHADDGMPFEFLKSVRPSSPPYFTYIDHGDFGGDASYPGPTSSFIRELDRLKIKPINLEYEVIRYGDHSEADWARRLPQIIRRISRF